VTGVSPSSDPDRIRASTADRERVARLLHDAFAEGRLDVAELDERLAAAYAAKTIGELRPLTADLPAGNPGVTPFPSARAHRPAGETPAPYGAPAPAARWPARDPALRGWLSVIAVNIGIWAVISITTGHVIYFWPVWLLIPLLMMTVRRLTGGGYRRDRRNW
jgi:DUF1707 SHOCT-like domain